jgi:hypothetical protein
MAIPTSTFNLININLTKTCTGIIDIEAHAYTLNKESKPKAPSKPHPPVLSKREYMPATPEYVVSVVPGIRNILHHRLDRLFRGLGSYPADA